MFQVYENNPTGDIYHDFCSTSFPPNVYFQYDQNGAVKGEIDLDGSLASSDGKIKFDDVGEDDDSSENSDEGDDNYESNHR